MRKSEKNMQIDPYLIQIMQKRARHNLETNEKSPLGAAAVLKYLEVVPKCLTF